MKIRRVLAIVAGAVVGLLTSSGATAQQSARIAPADILIVHAKVYTLNPQKPWAQSVAIRHGKIQAVGSEEEVEKYRGTGTKMVDAEEKLVLPGFCDSHVHFLDGSLALTQANLEEAENLEQIQKILREYAEKHPGNSWILGRGWKYAAFAPETLPRREMLDALFPDRPMYMQAYDEHTAWANSKALSLAGINKATPDPPNGSIVRDPVTGEPTGTVKEDTGMALIERVIPKPTREEKLTALRRGIKWANQNGLTRVHSAGGDFEELALYDELRQTKQLTLRFYIAYLLNPPELRQPDVETIETARRKYHDEWLDAGAVKFLMDGVVESHTAAFLDPYSDDPKLNGALFWDPEKYKNAVADLDRRNLQLFTHAIGDKAIRAALDAYEFVAAKNHNKDRRPRVEHIEDASAADLPRFGKLGVIASMQPLHSYPSTNLVDVWARNVGEERASRGWAWKSISDAGGRLAFGSDWPIVTLNPWEGIQTAVTRQTREGKPAGGFVPSQRLIVSQAIKGYTSGSAFAGRREKSEGSIEAGKTADVIIVDRNVFEIDPQNIGGTKVVTTIVGGKIVYEAK